MDRSKAYLENILVAVIPFFLPCKIAFGRSVDKAETLSRTDSGFGLEMCTRIATLPGADLQAGDATVRGRSIIAEGAGIDYHTSLVLLSASLQPALSRTTVLRPPSFPEQGTCALALRIRAFSPRLARPAARFVSSDFRVSKVSWQVPTTVRARIVNAKAYPKMLPVMLVSFVQT